MGRWMLIVVGVLSLGFSGAALSLCDYRIPETNIVDLKMSFHYRYYKDPARPGADINSGRFSVGYSQLYDTSLLGFEVVGVGDFVLSDLALAGMDSQVRGRVQRYLSPDQPYFAFGAVEGMLATEFPQPGLSLQTGLGYGRFADVTSLAKALRAERRLLDMGVIAASLPDELVLNLAEEIGRVGEYETMAELLTALEAMIQEAVGVNLTPKALLALEEIIVETGWQRYCGWNVSLGVGYEVLDPRGAEQDVVITLAGDVALAPEPGSQLRLSATYATPPYQAGRRSSIRLTAAYDYRLNDITTFGVDYVMRQEVYESRATGSQSATFQLSFHLGGVDVALQLAFAKRADAEEWTQDMVLSAVVLLL